MTVHESAQPSPLTDQAAGIRWAWLRNVAPRSASTPTRLQAGLWAALLGASIFLALHDFESLQVGSTYDDAIYVLMARTWLAHGRSGIAGLNGDLTTTAYPPGFPLLLALIAAAVPGSMNALRLLSLVATAGIAALLFWGWRWFSRLRSHWWALGVTGLYLLSPYTVSNARLIMSEPVYTLFCLGSWMLAEQVADGQTTARRGVGLGLALAGAALTRTIGWLNWVCVAAYLFVRHGRRAWRPVAAACVGTAGALLAVAAMTSFDLQAYEASPAIYLRKLQHDTFSPDRKADLIPGLPPHEFWARRLHGYIASDLRGLILPLGGGESEAALIARLGVPSPMPVIAYALAVVIIVGLGAWWLSEGPSAAILFAVSYLVFLMYWSWTGQRLLYPVMPQLFLALLLGAHAFARRVAALVGAKQPGLPGGVVAGLAIVLMAGSVAAAWRLPNSRAHAGDLAERTAWTRSNLPPGARLMSEAPAVDLLYGATSTVIQPNRVESAEQFDNVLAEAGVDFILIAPDAGWQPIYQPVYTEDTLLLLPVIDELSAAGRIRRVYTSGDGAIRVYEVAPK